MKINTGFAVVFQAGAEEVFDLIASAEGIASWLPIAELRLRRKGAFRAGDYRIYDSPIGRVKERVTSCDEAKFLSYEIVDAPYLQGLQGQITLSPKAGSTRLDWELSLVDDASNTLEHIKNQALLRSYMGALYSSLQYYTLKQRTTQMVEGFRGAA